MQQILSVLQIIISIVLIILILTQARGTGFGRTGAGGSSFTRRGLEKLIFRLTFVFVVLFLVIAIVSLLV